MKKGAKRRISIRKKWAINPKTKIKESERIYKRHKKKEIIKAYEPRTSYEDYEP